MCYLKTLYFHCKYHKKEHGSAPPSLDDTQRAWDWQAHAWIAFWLTCATCFEWCNWILMVEATKLFLFSSTGSTLFHASIFHNNSKKLLTGFSSCIITTTSATTFLSFTAVDERVSTAWWKAAFKQHRSIALCPAQHRNPCKKWGPTWQKSLMCHFKKTAVPITLKILGQGNTIAKLQEIKQQGKKNEKDSGVLREVGVLIHIGAYGFSHMACLVDLLSRRYAFEGRRNKGRPWRKLQANNWLLGCRKASLPDLETSVTVKGSCILLSTK